MIIEVKVRVAKKYGPLGIFKKNVWKSLLFTIRAGDIATLYDYQGKAICIEAQCERSHRRIGNDIRSDINNDSSEIEEL